MDIIRAQRRNGSLGGSNKKGLRRMYAITDKADRSKLLGQANKLDAAKALAKSLDGDLRLMIEAKKYLK